MTKSHTDVNASELIHSKKEKQALGFASKSLFICSLPQSQPRNTDGSLSLLWERTNGNATLSLTAHPTYGLPYGRDRLFAHWLKTKSVMLDSPVIHFKDGASILEEMGLGPKGDNKIWLNEVINRFTHGVMSYQEGDKYRGGKFKGSLIIKEMNGYFDKENYDSKQKSFFVLGDLFFEVPGVPIDLNTLRRIGRSWFVIDFFTFINYRLWVETKNVTQEDDLSKWKPIRIPMSAYRKQCGIPHTRSDHHFRSDIREGCKKIRAVQAEIKPFLDSNDVITISITRPSYIWTSKNQEAMTSFHSALERLNNSNL